MQAVGKIRRLNGVVQHYAWGGFDFIPNLLGVENKEHKSYAEYWLGAHANHSAVIEANGPLNSYISKNAREILGEKVIKSFNELPFLFKVLDVHKMLSIQVHPDMAAAKIGYKAENEKGIPLNAGNRNYKDENHKPELMVALSDFYLLHGFKSDKELERVLDNVREFGFLKHVFNNDGLKGLYESVMLMDQERVNEILRPLVERLLAAYRNHRIWKEDEGFWAARAALTFCNEHYYDRGIFSIYFFNVLHLQKGEGIYQPAGMPHAYLEGQNVEVMANSDNVLRAGLTDKYVDVPELMKHIIFEETVPNVIRFSADQSHKVFTTPAKEFELQQYDLSAGNEQKIVTSSAEVWLVLKGAIRACEVEDFELKKGEAVFIGSGANVSVICSAEATLFRVTVG